MLIAESALLQRVSARITGSPLAAARGACAVILLFALLLPTKTIFMVGDDGFFVFTIARNLARGHGLSADGHTLTNGVQPLWAFLLVPLYWQSVIPPLRGILLFSTALLAGSAWLFGSIAAHLTSPRISDPAPGVPEGDRQKVVFWGAAALYMTTWHGFWVHFNNLETGLLFFLLLLSLRLYLVLDFRRLRVAALFGALLGVLILARIDTSFFVAAILLTTSFELRRDLGLGRALTRTVLAGVVATCVSAPWWLYNRIVFGHFMPISGQAQQHWAIDGSRLQKMGLTLASFTAPFLPILQISFSERLAARLAMGSMCALAAVGAVVVARARHRRGASTGNLPASSTARRLDAAALAFALSLLMLIGYYTFGSFAVWFYGRYMAPVLLASMFAWFFEMRRAATRRPALFVAILSLVLGTFAFQILSMHRAFRPGITDAQRQIAVVREHVPAGEVVAAGQSGMLSYFWEPTVNMDGKVNAEVLTIQAPGAAHGYLVARGIHWYCDWKELVTLHLGAAPEERGWNLVARDGPWFLYHRD